MTVRYAFVALLAVFVGCGSTVEPDICPSQAYEVTQERNFWSVTLEDGRFCLGHGTLGIGNREAACTCERWYDEEFSGVY